jgi:hypothetical protein
MREAEPSVLNGLVGLQGKGVGQLLATAYPDIISDIRITEINYIGYSIISYRIYQDSRDDITLAYQDRQVRPVPLRRDENVVDMAMRRIKFVEL